jgi:hypothetical protein
LLLEGERLHHLRTVLRLGPGDEFSATDGAGAEYQVRVEHLGRDRGRALVLARSEPLRESTLALVLAQALPKGDRFSFVLEKAAELGVHGIVPLISRRTVAAGGGRCGGSGAVAAHHRVRRGPVGEDSPAGAAPGVLFRGDDRGAEPARAADSALGARDS